MTGTRVSTGVESLAQDPSILAGERVGLLTNFTGTLPGLERTVDALLAAGVNVVAILTPEHGLRGTAQAGYSEPDAVDDATGLPVLDTYGAMGAALDEIVRHTGIETIVFDMQDIGTRYWTYTWTMFDAMESAARTGIRFVVLDRPNPLGGVRSSGPGLDERFSSFVGRVDIPQRHGLTSGELARLFNLRFIAERAGRPVDLRVVPMTGFDRGMDFDDTGLPWVMPSPNLPTLDTAFAFAGTGLFEGTNLSEGRGTTRPFELIGAPYVDERLVAALRERALPGVAFREVWFVPTFHKHAGTTLRGVQLHIHDRRLFEPVGCALTMIDALATLYPGDFAFLPPRSGAVPEETGFAIDRLWGSDLLGARSNREARRSGSPALRPTPSPRLLVAIRPTSFCMAAKASEIAMRCWGGDVPVRHRNAHS